MNQHPQNLHACSEGDGYIFMTAPPFFPRKDLSPKKPFSTMSQFYIHLEREYFIALS